MFNLASTRFTGSIYPIYTVGIKSADEFASRVATIPEDGYTVVINGYACIIEAPNIFPTRGSILLYGLVDLAVKKEALRITLSTSGTDEVTLTPIDIALVHNLEILEILAELNRVVFY